MDSESEKFYIISTHSLTKRLTVLAPMCALTRIISTHSLTKRLTCIEKTRDSKRNISTHSLTKRLTAHGCSDMAGKAHFNSQPHEEADRRTAQ